MFHKIIYLPCHSSTMYFTYYLFIKIRASQLSMSNLIIWSIFSMNISWSIFGAFNICFYYFWYITSYSTFCFSTYSRCSIKWDNFTICHDFFLSDNISLGFRQNGQNAHATTSFGVVLQEWKLEWYKINKMKLQNR